MFVPILIAALALSQSPTDLQKGKQLFEGLCSRCHGFDGTGGEGPNLNRPTLTRAQDDESLRLSFATEFPIAACLECRAPQTMNSGSS
jgi:mono/diheme cytochrome c family protein